MTVSMFFLPVQSLPCGTLKKMNTEKRHQRAKQYFWFCCFFFFPSRQREREREMQDIKLQETLAHEKYRHIIIIVHLLFFFLPFLLFIIVQLSALYINKQYIININNIYLSVSLLRAACPVYAVDLITLKCAFSCLLMRRANEQKLGHLDQPS